MYLGVDIGGTKTLVAIFNSSGRIVKKRKFPTSVDYDHFLKDLADVVDKLTTEDIRCACIAVPGLLDRDQGMAIAFGNLPWRNIQIKDDIEKLINTPVLIEHDVNLGGLSEALLIKKDFEEVLYVTISTGIGTSIITNGVIDPKYNNSEGGQILLNYHGKLTKWEKFASGRAIVKKFGKLASEITNEQTWKLIAHNIALGLIDLIAILEPPVIVFGGGVGGHFSRYSKFLKAELKKMETPLTPIPVLRKAKRPDEAVIYGCFDFIKQAYAEFT